jgi:ribosome-associated protein
MTVASSIRITAQIEIPRSELRFSFVRSSGPGGQNVNKVASKAVLRWAVARSVSIPDDLRARFLSRFSRRINDRGELIIASQRYRDQAKNVDDCLSKLREMVLSVASIPKARKKSKVPKAVREARLQQKRITAAKKQRRKLPPID